MDGIKHSFNALSAKFGHEKPLEDVFELFGEFEKDQHDVLFDVSVQAEENLPTWTLNLQTFTGRRHWLDDRAEGSGRDHLQEA